METNLCELEKQQSLENFSISVLHSAGELL